MKPSSIPVCDITHYSGTLVLEISSCGANPEDVCRLRAVTLALPPLTLCQAEKPPRICFSKALHLHNHNILIQAYVKLFFSTH